MSYEGTVAYNNYIRQYWNKIRPVYIYSAFKDGSYTSRAFLDYTEPEIYLEAISVRKNPDIGIAIPLQQQGDKLHLSIVPMDTYRPEHWMSIFEYTAEKEERKENDSFLFLLMVMRYRRLNDSCIRPIKTALYTLRQSRPQAFNNVFRLVARSSYFDCVADQRVVREIFRSMGIDFKIKYNEDLENCLIDRGFSREEVQTKGFFEQVFRIERGIANRESLSEKYDFV